jgi:hypothetical protein
MGRPTRAPNTAAMRVLGSGLLVGRVVQGVPTAGLPVCLTANSQFLKAWRSKCVLITADIPSDFLFHEGPGKHVFVCITAEFPLLEAWFNIMSCSGCVSPSRSRFPILGRAGGQFCLAELWCVSPCHVQACPLARMKQEETWCLRHIRW